MNSWAIQHDFNNTWGATLSVTELQQRPIASLLLKQYWEDPALSRRKYAEILSLYLDKFENLFCGTLPISFHGHVTDALCPVTVMGMLMRLAIFSECHTRESIHTSALMDRVQLASLLGFSLIHLEQPRWAVTEGAYAAGFGSISNLSAHAPFRDHATGSLGVQIRLVGRSKADLSAHLSDLKKQGCIGVIAEIVSNQSEGRVISPAELRDLSEACAESGILLAIDETMTALRCGAPFAHQRPEYQNHKPDLVFFGKALNINGIGINFDGPYVSRLGIVAPKRRKEAVYDWQAVVTRAVSLPVLIDAIGVLEMAIAGDWVTRSRIIGEHLRQAVRRRAQSLKVVDGDREIEMIGGLDSFLFVHKEVSATFLVMGASSAGARVNWVRWLPRLDRQLMDRLNVESILSNAGAHQRRETSAYFDSQGLRPQWCFYCGGWARETTIQPCKTCFIDTCDDEMCIRQMLVHKCLD